MSGTRRATLRDIAASLGVSVNTVSRALADKDSVSEHTRAQVKAEAERLGYVPNTLARSLVLGSAMTLGLVITNPSNPFYAQLISGIELRGRAQGYTLLLLVTDESADNERQATESLLQSAVDGAIAVPVQSESDHWKRLEGSGIPLVFVNREVPGRQHDFVGIDHGHGAYQATKHVIERGARQVWALEEDLPITTISERITGFRRAMQDAGLPLSADSVISVPTRRYESAVLPWQPEEAYRVAQDLVRRPDRPDAIIAGNDFFALGLYRALAEQGLRVPDDMLIVGYGDHPYSGFLSPPLTSVHLPAQQVGAASVDLLLSRMRQRRNARGAGDTTGRDEGDRPEKLMLAPELIVRESTTRAVRAG
ncbi:LacI family DNA-binding transcriptional regulator [Phytoactinopolyspora halotolerans]|uniref:LacI family transcriptional regulator n=1 Tax=Phytoactinopolyspora halotolerans TaxID=1981512 RepID=A0A6L9SJP9_9ACTN|nr:LacI family DNA-binding transcriptional regulator [Phytoactinopolyspora halotolerans]NEE04300.1 LacI family transcriptional regulator [Phytoactinopolyspora halotolerans]